LKQNSLPPCSQVFRRIIESSSQVFNRFPILPCILFMHSLCYIVSFIQFTSLAYLELLNLYTNGVSVGKFINLIINFIYFNYTNCNLFCLIYCGDTKRKTIIKTLTYNVFTIDLQEMMTTTTTMMMNPSLLLYLLYLLRSQHLHPPLLRSTYRLQWWLI